MAGRRAGPPRPGGQPGRGQPGAAAAEAKILVLATVLLRNRRPARARYRPLQTLNNIRNGYMMTCGESVDFTACRRCAKAREGPGTRRPGEGRRPGWRARPRPPPAGGW